MIMIDFFCLFEGEVKEAMVPVVSTTIGLVSPTSSISRMPPDGHEFPQKYTEEPPLEKSPSMTTTVKGSEERQQSESVLADSAVLPPLPASEPPSAPFKYPPIYNGDVEIFTEKKFFVPGVPTELPVQIKSSRNSFWRQDEKSEKSVRDKIAMFSSVPDSAPPNPSNGKLNKYKSSEDVFYCDETDCNRNFPNGKMFSRSVMTLDKVSGGGNYMKKPPYGSDTPIPTTRPLDYSNRTQSSMDLSSSSSAYSSSCSPDSSLSSNSSYLGYSSTLPRKKTRNDESKNNLGKKENVGIQRTTSFSVHGRSQSLLDINPTPYKSRYLSESLQDDGQKPGSLNLLIEQRRKNLSKLRGLVIPEKSTNSVPGLPIVDLPEIRSRDLILSSKVPSAYKEKNLIKQPRATLPEVVVPKVSPTHLWDMQSKVPNIPKYSPAFKRKSIAVFGAKELMALNDKKESTITPLQRSMGEPIRAPLKPPRNVPLVRQNSVCDDRKYDDAVGSFLCEPEHQYTLPRNHKIGEITKSYDMYVPKRKSLSHGKYRLHSDLGRSEEDSDNDSAVSSSRSSISHGFSPPASPLLDNQHQTVDDPGLRSRLLFSPERNQYNRTLSSDMRSSMSVSSNSSNPPSETQQMNMCTNEGNLNDANNKRILKPQSVEAINRKNVLASAKYSRGFDVKSGSPLIQRKFLEVVENGLNKNNDFNYTNSHNPMKKHSENGLTVVDKDNNTLTKPKIEKVAYITDVVDDATDVLSDSNQNKKKLEKSESLPATTTDPNKSSTSSLRKASVPHGYGSWNKNNNNNWNETNGNTLESSSGKESDVSSKNELLTENSLPKNSPDEKGFERSNLIMKFGKMSTDSGIVADSSSSIESIDKTDKKMIDAKDEQMIPDKVLNGNRGSINDIRKSFEKVETLPSNPARLMKSMSVTTGTTNNYNGINGNHFRGSSLDSTASEDGPYGCPTNLFREQFGSITSLASSTSLISPQVRESEMKTF